jgi:hypothetical protein
MNDAQTKIRGKRELEVLRIRLVESLFAYNVCGARKSTGRVVFFAPRGEKPNACYLHTTPLPVVCKGFHMPLKTCPALFARDGAP